MPAFISILSGFFISFLGGLPPGNLNVTAVRLALASGVRKAYQFSTGVVLVEIVYLYFCMHGVSRVHHYSAAVMILQWLTVFLLFLMAAHCLIATLWKKREEISNNQQKTKEKSKTRFTGFALGLALSAINVLQIPYWTGWITIARQNNWVGMDYTAYLFILAAGLGTFLCLAVFILAGQELSSWLTRKKRALDLVFGMVFFAVALVQLYHIIKP
ncbi:MAG TPA: LysE family transporter [Puia sp.]|jgi:threonine/homoserine/homoserine lactone efflux protein|nr:LysE family transporter [Puia sp.]